MGIRAMVEVDVASDSTEDEEAKKYRLQLPTVALQLWKKISESCK